MIWQIVAIIACMIQHVQAEACMSLLRNITLSVIGYLFLSSPFFLMAEDIEASPSLIADQAFGPLFTKMILMLACLLLVLYAGAWALRRVNNMQMNKIQGNSSIQILERRMLNSKSALYFIQVEDQKILAVETLEGVHPLAHWNNRSSKDSEKTEYL